MHNADQCPLCGTRNVPYIRTGDGSTVNCGVCGTYSITGTASATVQNWEEGPRIWLAGRAARHWLATNRPLLINGELLDEVNGPEIHGVSAKQEAFLLALGAKSKHPGASVVLVPTDYVLMDGAGAGELHYHVQSLIDRDYLQYQNGKSHLVVLTAKGWEHIDRLRNPIGGNRSDIFVAMSFSKDLYAAWDEGIRPGVAEAGFIAKRVDTVDHNKKIDDQIIAGIRASFATIVDVTLQNAGAYFEAGFAMGLGRPVIWTVREDDLKNLHFDTRQFRHVVWNEPADLRQKVRDHLLAVFGKGPA